MKYTPIALERGKEKLGLAARRCMEISQECESIAAELKEFEETFCAEIALLQRAYSPIHEEAEQLLRMGCVLGECIAEYEATEQENEDAWWQTSAIDQMFIPGFHVLRSESCRDIEII